MFTADKTDGSTRSRVAGSIGGDVPEKYYVVQNNEMVRVKYVLVYTGKDSPRRFNFLLALPLRCAFGNINRIVISVISVIKKEQSSCTCHSGCFFL